MVIAENYKLWLSCFISVKPIAIAQQGRTDYKGSVLLPIKKIIQNYAFKMQH
jgi:hypothetical protein